MHGVQALAPGAKTWSAFTSDVAAGRISHAIALGADVPSEAETLDKLDALVVLAAHGGALTGAAKVLLPAASWAEASGTYVNKTGISQLSRKAIEPQGDSKPAWQIIAELGKALGHDLGLGKLGDVRKHLAGGGPSAEAASAGGAE